MGGIYWLLVLPWWCLRSSLRASMLLWDTFSLIQLDCRVRLMIIVCHDLLAVV